MDKFPLWTTLDLLSQTPYRSPSLELRTDGEPLEPENGHEDNVFIRKLKPENSKQQVTLACLWCLWYSFDSGLLRLLCLRHFYKLRVHVGVVRQG